jgi:hypothetical protein
MSYWKPRILYVGATLLSASTLQISAWKRPLRPLSHTGSSAILHAEYHNIFCWISRINVFWTLPYSACCCQESSYCCTSEPLNYCMLELLNIEFWSSILLYVEDTIFSMLEPHANTYCTCRTQLLIIAFWSSNNVANHTPECCLSVPLLFYTGAIK